MAIKEAKYKIDRSLSLNILGRSKSPIFTRNYKPGQHGRNQKYARKKLSDYGIKLNEQKKVRHFYGDMRSKDIKRVVIEGINMKGKNSDNIIKILESRLSSVVYRSKFAITPFAAKQLVNHGHILVNGKKIDIPSYRVKESDKIEVIESMRNNEHVNTSMKSTERIVPTWIANNNYTSIVTKLPNSSDIVYPIEMNYRLLIELFSK